MICPKDAKVAYAKTPITKTYKGKEYKYMRYRHPDERKASGFRYCFVRIEVEHKKE